ncbi:uncharacterized protein [Cherax quadricarinatus]|uniref:uncharacterized protein n=1 Tax=Cherax quadricarinatus TaxID=27406 RepID=UPI00387ED140
MRHIVALIAVLTVPSVLNKNVVKPVEQVGMDVEMMVDYVVKQHVTGCHTVLITTTRHSYISSTILRRLSEGVEASVVVEAASVLNPDQVAQDQLLPSLWSYTKRTCRALILDLTSTNNTNLVLSLVEASGLWKLPKTRVVVVGVKTQVMDVLLHHSLRNTIHALYFTVHRSTIHNLSLQELPRHRNPSMIKQFTQKVPHKRLVQKLEDRSGITGKALQWIREFLRGRQQLVMVRDKVSEWAPVTSGIPQVMEIREIPERIWGTEKNGYFNGMLGNFQREEIDIGGPLGSIEERMKVMEITQNQQQESDINDLPTRTHKEEQVLLGTWLVFCLVITTGFSSSLIAHLTVQGKTKPPETFENLVTRDNWRWGIESWVMKGASQQYFANNTDPVVEQIRKKLEIVTADNALSLVKNGSYTLFSPKFYIKVIIESFYTDNYGQTPFYITNEGLQLAYENGWGFRKGAPFYLRFKQLLLQLKESGITDKWTNDVVARRVRNNRGGAQLHPQVSRGNTQNSRINGEATHNTSNSNRLPRQNHMDVDKWNTSERNISGDRSQPRHSVQVDPAMIQRFLIPDCKKIEYPRMRQQGSVPWMVVVLMLNNCFLNEGTLRLLQGVVLEADLEPHCSGIIIHDTKNIHSPDFIVSLINNVDIQGLEKQWAPWGVTVMQVAVDNHNANLTQELPMILDYAHQVRQESWCVSVIVLSDDTVFLTSFAEVSLKSRVLVWSTRLLVLTRLPLQQLQQLLGNYWTFSMMNTMVLILNESLNHLR